jgi:hypothetical protein
MAKIHHFIYLEVELNCKTKSDLSACFALIANSKNSLSISMARIITFKGRYRISIQIWLPEIFPIIIIFPLDIFYSHHYETLLSGKRNFLCNRRVKGL